MRNVVTKLFVALSLLTASTVTAEYGKVRLPGEATIKHDGDYVVYNLSFTSNCQTEEETSITEVSNNAALFADWLDERALTYSNGTIEYWADIASTYRDESPYIYNYYYSEGEEKIPNPCYEKFSTSQSLTIRVNKASDLPGVTKEIVQGFYEEIYQYLWPLNRRVSTDISWTSARVTNVNKGINDDTRKRMKEEAYAAAANVATARFLSVLGKNFEGQWFFEGADFTGARYTDSSDYAVVTPIPVPVAGPVMEPALPKAPDTVISLQPLYYSVDGTFEFRFTRDFNDVAPAR